MKFKGRLELEQGLKAIDIAPLINVVFLLLIFFMLTSSFLLQPGIKVNLPKVLTSESVTGGNIEVVVTSENELYLDGSSTNFKGLEAMFKQAASRRQSVLIKADKRASLGKVVEIFDLGRGAGVSQINIATNYEK